MKARIAPSHGSLKLLIAAHEFPQRMAGWGQLLELCGKTPSKKLVHQLRVATQRLLAELNFCGEQQELDCRAVRVLHRWQKSGKRLRRALSPVRDADACLERLTHLRRWLGEPGSQECPGTQLEVLRGSLQRARKRAAKKLVDIIGEQSDRTAMLSGKLADRLAEPMLQLQNKAPARLVPLLEELAGAFPQLDAGNLHRFRKRIKQVRSLAEVAATTDSGAREKAGLLREMQVAIGQWRDLQVLAKLARRKRAMRLAGVIDAKAEDALAAALTCCNLGAVRLLDPSSLTSESRGRVKSHHPR